MEDDKIGNHRSRAGTGRSAVSRPVTVAGKGNTGNLNSSRDPITNKLEVTGTMELEGAPIVLTLEEAGNKLLDLGLPDSVLMGLSDNGTTWKDKVKGLTTMNEWIMENIGLVGQHTECVVRFLKAKFKDWKESNLNIMKELFCLITHLLSTKEVTLTRESFSLLAPLIIGNISDNTYLESCQIIVFAFVQATNPKNILITLIQCAQDAKLTNSNPKTVVELCSLLTTLVNNLTLKYLPVKEVLEFGKVSIGNKNPVARTAANGLFKAIYHQMGGQLNDLLTDIPPQTLKPLLAEFEKIAPMTSAECKIQFRDDADVDIREMGDANPIDPLPRVDISRESEKLHQKLTDKTDWKVRKEGLDALENLIQGAGGRILPNGLTLCLSQGIFICPLLVF